MELHAQGAEPRLGELSGQARRLRVTLTRFDDIGERVHASEHGEVHEHRPWNAREEPADVVVGRKAAEQVAEEHAERRPSDAEDRGTHDVHGEGARPLLTRDRESPAEHIRNRRQRPEKQPLGALEHQILPARGVAGEPRLCVGLERIERRRHRAGDGDQQPDAGIRWAVQVQSSKFKVQSSKFKVQSSIVKKVQVCNSALLGSTVHTSHF